MTPPGLQGAQADSESGVSAHTHTHTCVCVCVCLLQLEADHRPAQHPDTVQVGHRNRTAVRPGRLSCGLIMSSWFSSEADGDGAAADTLIKPGRVKDRRGGGDTTAAPGRRRAGTQSAEREQRRRMTAEGSVQSIRSGCLTSSLDTGAGGSPTALVARQREKKTTPFCLQVGFLW